MEKARRQDEALWELKQQLKASEIAFQKIDAARRTLQARRAEGKIKDGSDSFVTTEEERMAFMELRKYNRYLKTCFKTMRKCLSNELENRQRLEGILARERQAGGRVWRRAYTLPLGLELTNEDEDDEKKGQRVDSKRKEKKPVQRAATWRPRSVRRRGGGGLSRNSSQRQGGSRDRRKSANDYHRSSLSMGSLTFRRTIQELGQENMYGLNRGRQLATVYEKDEGVASPGLPHEIAANEEGTKELKSILRRSVSARRATSMVSFDVSAKA